MFSRQARTSRDRKTGPQEKLFDGECRPNSKPALVL